MDYEALLEKISELEKIIEKNQWVYLIQYLSVSIVITILIFFVQKVIEHRFEKKEIRFSTNLDTISEYLKRNEDPVKDVKTNTIIEANKKRIDLLQRINRMYFEVLYYDVSTDQDRKIMKEIREKLVSLRIESFGDYIYWGGETQHLIRALVMMDNWLFDKPLAEKNISDAVRRQLTEESDEAWKCILILKEFVVSKMQTLSTLSEIDVDPKTRDGLQKKMSELLKESTKTKSAVIEDNE